ncbi:TonB-dependent receptor [Parabacteroides sp. OttesenSCG-928-G06]|nr:TonB-dependent receptor [Parabacteroides sp. OttesenSCG-928-G06]
MRLTILFLLIGFHFGYATISYSQSTQLSVKVTDKTVEDVFKIIEDNSEYIFFYYETAFDADRKINLDIRNETVDKILDKVFDATNTTYTIEDRQIFISRKAEPKTDVVPQQGRTITGFVADGSTREALIGVNVSVKGTTTGAITNVDGQFSLTTNLQNPVLVISYIGYKTEEVTVGNQQTLNIVLMPDMLEMDEVIVVAYGTTRKTSFTGSSTVVKSEHLEKISGSGFAEALQGMSAGVNVINNQGNPGGETKIQIRGIGTMGRSSTEDPSKPLYIVDGMPFDGQLTSISPSDIESMTVLKDAAASSLYGSRAANGVVVITTKKGKSGKPTVNFKAAWGTSDYAVSNPTKANPYQHMTNTWEGMYNDQYYKYGRSDAEARKYASENVLDAVLIAKTNAQGQKTYVSPFKHISDYYVLESGEINPNLQMVWTEDDYDWYSILFDRKLRQDYSFDVSGTMNDNKTTYYFSGSYLDDQGYALSQYYKRYSFRANVSTEITKWLEMGGSLAYSNSRQNTSGFVRSLVFTTTMASPYLRNIDNTDWVYSEKTGDRMFSYGDYNKNFFGAHPMAGIGDYWDNPNDHNFSNNARSMISSRFYAQATLPYEIKFRTNLSLDDNTSYGYSYGSAVHGQGQLEPFGVTVKTTGGSASRSTTRLNSMTWNNLLTWDKKFGDHSLNALFGHELYTYNTYYHYGYGEGIMQLDQYELASTTTNWSATSNRNKYALLSFFGRLDYGYKDKYYLSASYRRDGSSRFSKDSRWGDFFSVGGSWRITQESFMEDTQDWLSNLALRASYGTSGNDKIINASGGLVYYGYQATFSSKDMYGNAGLQPQTVATPELKWENNKQFNVAVDFSLFNRLSGTVEYYNRRSDDLLYYKQLPYSSQAGNATGLNTNLGDMRNSGFEFTLSARAINTQDFSWDIDANWTTQKNEIVYLPGGEYTFTSRTSTWKIAEGHSRWEFYMPSFAGVDPQTGNALYYIKDGSGNRVTTDDYSKVTLNDYEWQGSAIPKGFASLTNSFRYKGLDLSFMLYFSYGAKMYDYVWLERVTLRNGVGVIQDQVDGRWRQPGDNASQPRWSYDNYQSTRQATNYFIFNNDFLRLRNLTIGYSLPKSVTHKLGMSNARIYVTGDNLMTFGNAAKRHTEPETEISGNNYNGSELTDNGFPGTRRVIMGGIQISF